MLDRLHAEPLWPPDGTAVLAELLRQPAWMRDALCREHPQLPWFPTVGQDPRPAQDVCAICLVRVECLDEALAQPGVAGVWGGTTAIGRRRLRRDPDAPVLRRQRHDTRRLVLELLATQGPCAPDFVARQLRIGQVAVRRMLYRLAAAHEVIRYAGGTFGTSTGAA
jgi:WhiB family redox-sensing transcriptional regulator